MGKSIVGWTLGVPILAVTIIYTLLHREQLDPDNNAS
jgi:hypothetical protein